MTSSPMPTDPNPDPIESALKAGYVQRADGIAPEPALGGPTRGLEAAWRTISERRDSDGPSAGRGPVLGAAAVVAGLLIVGGVVLAGRGNDTETITVVSQPPGSTTVVPDVPTPAGISIPKDLEVALTDEAIGPIPFGTPRPDTMQALRDRLGPPDEETSAPGSPPDSAATTPDRARWGGLWVVFDDGRLGGWALTTTDANRAPVVVPDGVVPPGELTLGMTRAEVHARSVDAAASLPTNRFYYAATAVGSYCVQFDTAVGSWSPDDRLTVLSAGSATGSADGPGDPDGTAPPTTTT